MSAVTLQVDAAVAGEYLAWLHGHARAMRALPGLLAAHRVLEDLGDY